MTATLTHLPAAAGGALLGALGRSAMWTLLRLVRAPLSSALLAVMTVGIAMATTNALYLQAGQHPAPLFVHRTAEVAPIAPKTAKMTKKPKPATTKKPEIVPLVTSSVPKHAPVPAISDAVAQIDNADVKLLQQKLAALAFYDGDADGFYGPKTAEAIRAFEKSMGLPVVGALTPEILKAVSAVKMPERVTKPTVAPKTEKPVAGIEPTRPVAKAPTVKSELAQQTEPTDSETARTQDPLVKIVQRVASAAQQTVSASKPHENAVLVEKVQRGLSSLGFLRGKIDGIAGEATAKAIRNFEVYYNYKVTGEATPELVDLLAQAGASTN